MRPLLENALLTTDLDCNFFDLLNVAQFVPTPLNLVTDDDPRLSDVRNPIDGSVTDFSVANNAAIDQSKLNLNGLIPSVWLGVTSTTAAQGNLAEYFANKGQLNGYASLDGTGKVPVSQLPLGAGTGTITSIGLSMPAEFAVTGSPVTVSGTIAVAWVPVGQSWFGNPSASSAAPTFNTGLLPISLIPPIDAGKITTGIFDPARLPLAIGVGVSHAPGAAPDPGDGSTGSPFDYLARDMTYRPFPSFGPGYQPQVPTPEIEITTGFSPYTVQITSPLPGVSLFFSINSSVNNFQPVPDTGQILLYTGQTLYVYGALAGYTNSDMVHFSAPSAPPGESVTTGGLPDELVYGDDLNPVTVGP